MMSIAVVMIIATITIASGGTDVQTNLPRVTVEILDGCPPLESVDYQVTVIDSVTSLIGGCAYVNYNSSGVMTQSFSLWFSSVKHVGQRCHDQGIEHLKFYCLAKSLSPTDDTDEERGRMKYIKLYDGAPNKTENPNHRCALYKTSNESATTFRMAVSENGSCRGLLNMLSHPKMKIPKSKQGGSMLLFFNKTRIDKLVTSSLADTTTTESIESIAKRYERRGYLLQNFGNRPNPFSRSTNMSKAVQNRGKREQRHALSYMIGGDGRGSVMSLYGSQSAINEKDNSANTAETTEDKIRLRQIEHMQIRRTRSASNVESKSNTNIPVSKGVKPCVKCTNRVDNNGFIKSPAMLGLWDLITNIFKY